MHIQGWLHGMAARVRGGLPSNARTRRAPRPRSNRLESLEPRTLMAARALAAAAEVSELARRPARAERPLGRLGVVQAYSNITYSRTGAKLDVYVPVGRKPPEGGWPAIVALPGGGWRWASRGSYGGAVASLARHGYVVVAADYAYSGPGGPVTWPANIEDVRDAIRWVRRVSGNLRVNPKKIVAMGESAGGHLAALAGVLPDGTVDPTKADTGVSPPPLDGVSARVQAVVDFYGPMDLRAEWDAEPGARGYLAPFLGGPPDRVADRYAAASPIRHVTPDDPPFFITQGTADNIIPVAQSKAMVKALRDAGVPVTFRLLPRATHGYRFAPNSANMKALLAFLDQALNGTARSRR
jgi:acetyl esterase/lipase